MATPPDCINAKDPLQCLQNRIEFDSNERGLDPDQYGARRPAEGETRFEHRRPEASWQAIEGGRDPELRETLPSQQHKQDARRTRWQP